LRSSSRHWRIILAGAVAAAIVGVAGYAHAVGAQQQGNAQKLYVTSAPDFLTTSVAWTPVAGLLISGTWAPGDLIVARLDAQTTCNSPTGAQGACRIFIGLTGLDQGAPNIELQPTGAGTFAMDSTLVPASEWDSQSHALTRYITVPRVSPGVPYVWVEAAVSNPDVLFFLHMAVLTVEVVKPTAT
jgi:hypothetical protein